MQGSQRLSYYMANAVLGKSKKKKKKLKGKKIKATTKEIKWKSGVRKQTLKIKEV